MFKEIAKCLLMGVGVGLLWLPICFGSCILFLIFRDAGVFFLFFIIFGGVFLSWISTKKYLSKETNRLRGALALSERYFFLGACFGFVLCPYASDIAFATFLGGFIGAFSGSVGGAFQGWLYPRPPIMDLPKEQKEDNKVE